MPQWTGGTLFPHSSKKVARATNAASNNRPVVVLANLSGFDGSPESMRKWQLEYGAEIGRAVVNFEGPIVFCVVSRYHGGAFVVFSNKLNEKIAQADGADKVRLRARLSDLYQEVYSEKLGEVANEYDGVHSVHRAQEVGSVHHIIAPERLRPYLIEAIERGMQRETEAVEQASTGGG